MRICVAVLVNVGVAKAALLCAAPPSRAAHQQRSGEGCDRSMKPLVAAAEVASGPPECTALADHITANRWGVRASAGGQYGCMSDFIMLTDG